MDKLALFLTSCAALLLQATWARILSVTHWYHLSFLVVGTAMLGHGIGGMVGFRSGGSAGQERPQWTAQAMLLMALATLGGFFLVNSIPFAPFAMLRDARQLPLLLVVSGAIAGPFGCAGYIAATLVSRNRDRPGPVYAADLMGAGSGAVLYAVVLPRMGAVGGIFCGAVLASAAGALIAGGRLRALAFCLALILSVSTGAVAPAVPVRIDPDKVFLDQAVSDRLQSPDLLFSGWTSASRIDVLQAPWGPHILIDAGTAMTRIPVVDRPVTDLGHIQDERAVVFPPGTHSDVLVVGSGGGADVLAALQQDASRVVAVESNPLINQLVTGRFAEVSGHIFADPRVELHTDEARSFIRRSHENFDAILATHTISNAAAAAGALAMSEDYLLTVDAFQDYLDHLTPTGALLFTRPESQIPRMVATVREALNRLGYSDAASRMVVFAEGPPPSFYAGVIVRLTPFAPSDRLLLDTHLDPSRFRVLYLPREIDERRTNEEPYQSLLTLPAKELAHLYANVDARLDPVDDDRPFFNQRARLNTLYARLAPGVFRQPLSRIRLAVETLPVGETVVTIVALEAAGLLVFLTGFGVRRLRRHGITFAAGSCAYFICLGLGYMFVEIALLQRLTLLIGRPEHAYVVVLMALLVSSGIGSIWTERVAASRHRVVVLFVTIALAIIALAILPFGSGLSLPLAARASLAAALVSIAGLPLGVPFPLGIGYSDPAGHLVPVAWSVNASASVLGAALAVLLAMAVGLSRVLMIASVLYIIAGAVLLRWSAKSSISGSS